MKKVNFLCSFKQISEKNNREIKSMLNKKSSNSANQKLVRKLNCCLLPFGMNVLHLFAKMNLYKVFKETMVAGIREIYPGKD